MEWLAAENLRFQWSSVRPECTDSFIVAVDRRLERLPKMDDKALARRVLNDKALARCMVKDCSPDSWSPTSDGAMRTLWGLLFVLVVEWTP
mmetsp:Transcript_18015/g.49716  ORF Transcript_18015/g.49716 Transcript_18015/m.49716 type:complete len:91 (-) Transcript_18015:230-502(-)